METGPQVVHSRGSCHGLPVIADEHQGLSAIVVGASGMSGQSMIDVLLLSPKRWSTIYALSRRPPQADGDSTALEHVPTDLLKEPSEIAKTLTEHGVQADVVFFFGYVQLSAEERKYSAANKDSAQKLCDINGRLLQNFLQALNMASISPKRLLLQTGLKNYQCHQGPAKAPFNETDPRLDSDELGPNFYFTQEDILFDYCKNNTATSYNVTMPSWILGDVAASDMTTIYPLAVFAAVQRKLGQPLAFPGDTPAWEKVMPMSSAVLNSHFHQWLVLEAGTAGERFNIVDDSEFTWMNAWPVIASWFGIGWSPPAEEDEDEYATVEMPVRPRGYGPKGRCRSSFSLADWTKRAETQSAWQELRQEYGLAADPFEGGDGMFAALQFSLTMSWSWATKMDKARKFGWHGHVDSLESIHQVMNSLARRKMIPPLERT
ncbi:uncharacterized protein LTR77_008724 [Saxophila tyrrhenica]|uniref:PRISE-like Rossmann-fold domain-containing protein n=1 Tax=Saxophila tyrrhenica TaxID=1690608 RepID=A0AAV9P0I7_9PEZI|nr:hypothetical protein LTR77_008724 [Saxophila tyrrhenica]